MSWQLNQTFIFEGRPVAFDIQGAGSPIVIVHGTPWSSFNMRHLIQELSTDFKVHYFDLLGYGQSDQAAGDVSLGIQNRLLDAFLDHWNLENPFVIGHDFGGATVLRTHLINGRQFKKIVLIDPVAVSPWGSSFFKHVQQHEAAFAGVPDYIQDAIVRAYVQTAAYQPIPPETMDHIVKPWSAGEGKAAFYRQIAQADSRFTEEVQVRYGEINTPTLILWGEEDTWIPVEKGEQLHQLIPSSTFHVIPESGHLIIEERPNDLLNKIRPFFAGKS